MQSISNFKTETKISGDLTLTLNLQEAAMLRLIIGGISSTDKNISPFVFSLYKELGQHQEVMDESGKLLGQYRVSGLVIRK